MHHTRWTCLPCNHSIHKNTADILFVGLSHKTLIDHLCIKSCQGQMNLYTLQWFFIPNIIIFLLKISEISSNKKVVDWNHDIEVKDIVHMPKGNFRTYGISIQNSASSSLTFWIIQLNTISLHCQISIPISYTAGKIKINKPSDTNLYNFHAVYTNCVCIHYLSPWLFLCIYLISKPSSGLSVI